jgi:putative peptidoglycan lipid II flippase
VSLFKSASTVSLFTLASRVTGLVRDLLINAMFGASALTDAYVAAFRIPNMFRRLFAEGAFSQAFVPVLGKTRTQEGDAATRDLVTRVATVLTWTLLLTCVLGVLAAPVLVWAMASGLRDKAGSFDAAVVMTRWMFPYLALISLAGMAGGVLNTWRKFALPAAAPVLLNVAMIAAALWGAPWFGQIGIEPIYALAGGVIVGGILQLGLQLPSLYRLGMLPRIGLTWQAVRQAWRDPATQNVARLMLPSLLGVGVAQLSLLINSTIASHLATGSMTWIFNADRLMEFPTAMLGVALGVVLMPHLSAARASADTQRYSDLLDGGLRLVVLLAAPCSVALLAFSLPLVATVFHYGKFSALDVQATALALTGYGVGLLGLVAVKVLAPGYYASQDVRTPVRIAVVVLLVTQLLNVVLVPVFQHAALTLSIGLGALLNAAWLWWGLRRRGTFKAKPGWGVFVLQVAAASALLALFLSWARLNLPWLEPVAGNKWLRAGHMGLVLAASGTIYFSVLWASGLKLRALVSR